LAGKAAALILLFCLLQVCV